jgi:D-psicose/D-tagatose/L-ribulose 3-epimerase
MKIGVNFLLWASAMNQESVGLIRKAASLGFDGIEIFIDEPANIDTKALRAAASDLGLGVTCCAIVGPDRHLISDDPRIRRAALDYLKAGIEISHSVGSRVFCGPLYAGVGVLAGRPRTRQEWDRAVEGLSEAALDAEAAGVCLCLEPLNRFETYFINIAADAVQLAGEIGSPNIRIMLDTFHMNIEEKDPAAAVRQAGSLLGHMHCSENDRGTPGTGHVDWTGVFRALRDIRYNGWLVIESFVLGNEAIARAASIWRDIAPSGDHLASEGLTFLRKMSAG